jgi:integrase
VSVNKLPSGRFECRWREGSRNRSRTFDRKSDAIRFDAEQRRIKQLGGIVPARTGGETLDEFAAAWFTERTDLAKRTRELYHQLIDFHLSPYLGHMPLSELTPKVIHAWQRQRLADDAGPVQIGKAQTLLSQIMDQAVVRELIARNPVHGLRKPSAPPKKIPTPATPEEVEAIREHMLERDGIGSATLISVLAYGGTRPAEALALEWSDVDANRLSIVKALDQEGIVKTPKTATGRRWVTLPRQASQDLTAWRLASPLGGLIFPTPRGVTWKRHDWQNWRRRWFDKAAEAAGRSDLTPYALRHSCASLMIAAGQPVTAVAKTLGHSPMVCLSVYAHSFEAMEGRDPVSVEAWIAKARNGEQAREAM